MNCDDAFDQITDPLLCRSPELDWHLQMCPRCRQMREVLAPALDLLAPDDADFGIRDTWDYYAPNASSAFLSPESLAVAERAASDLSRSSRRETQRRPGIGLLRYAAALFVGAALAIGGFLVIQSPTTSRAANLPAANSCLLIQHPAPVESLRKAGADNVIRKCQLCHVASEE